MCFTNLFHFSFPIYIYWNILSKGGHTQNYPWNLDFLFFYCSESSFQIKFSFTYLVSCNIECFTSSCLSDLLHYELTPKIYSSKMSYYFLNLIVRLFSKKNYHIIWYFFLFLYLVYSLAEPWTTLVTLLEQYSERYYNLI